LEKIFMKTGKKEYLGPHNFEFFFISNGEYIQSFLWAAPAAMQISFALYGSWLFFLARKCCGLC